MNGHDSAAHLSTSSDPTASTSNHSLPNGELNPSSTSTYIEKNEVIGLSSSSSPAPGNCVITNGSMNPSSSSTAIANGVTVPSSSSSSSSSEIEFDPSAPETLQERVTSLSSHVRQLKRKLREAQKEIASLRVVVRENEEKAWRGKASVAVQCDAVAPEGHGWTEVTEKEEGAGLSISESIRQAANKVQVR